jgi:hypothetical protein
MRARSDHFEEVSLINIERYFLPDDPGSGPGRRRDAGGAVEESYTGQYLRELLKRRAKVRNGGRGKRRSEWTLT